MHPLLLTKPIITSVKEEQFTKFKALIETNLIDIGNDSFPCEKFGYMLRHIKNSAEEMNTIKCGDISRSADKRLLCGSCSALVTEALLSYEEMGKKSNKEETNICFLTENSDKEDTDQSWFQHHRSKVIFGGIAILTLLTSGIIGVITSTRVPRSNSPNSTTTALPVKQEIPQRKVTVKSYLKEKELMLEINEAMQFDREGYALSGNSFGIPKKQIKAEDTTIFYAAIPTDLNKVSMKFTTIPENKTISESDIRFNPNSQFCIKLYENEKKTDTIELKSDPVDKDSQCP